MGGRDVSLHLRGRERVEGGDVHVGFARWSRPCRRVDGGAGLVVRSLLKTTFCI